MGVKFWCVLVLAILIVIAVKVRIDQGEDAQLRIEFRGASLDMEGPRPWHLVEKYYGK